MSDLGGTMNENLRDEIALHRPSHERSDQGTPMCSCGHDLGLDETWGEHVADAVLAVVGPELDRLRAQVERLTITPDSIEKMLGIDPNDPLHKMAQLVLAAEAERDDLRARLAKVEAERDDWRAARRVAADAADRFRDVLEEALDLPENPGDDELVRLIRERHGKDGPEPRRWRDFLVGAEAMLDQIIADRAALASVPEPSVSEPPCTCTSYVVDYSDPDRYHAENIDREDDPACPVHGDSEPHAPCCDACGGSGASDEASSNGLCWDCRGTGCAHEPSEPAPDADREAGGDGRPCKGRNVNVCVAEGCYGEACIKDGAS